MVVAGVGHKAVDDHVVQNHTDDICVYRCYAFCHVKLRVCVCVLVEQPKLHRQQGHNFDVTNNAQWRSIDDYAVVVLTRPRN